MESPTIHLTFGELPLGVRGPWLLRIGLDVDNPRPNVYAGRLRVIAGLGFGGFALRAAFKNLARESDM